MKEDYIKGKIPVCKHQLAIMDRTKDVRWGAALIEDVYEYCKQKWWEGMVMKLKYDVEIMEMGNQFIAIPVGHEAMDFRGVVRLNETAKTILELLREDVTEADIIASVQKEYGASQDVLAQDVHECIKMFRSRDMLI